MRTSLQMLLALASIASVSAAPAPQAGSPGGISGGGNGGGENAGTGGSFEWPLEKRQGEDGSIFGGGKGDGGAPGGKWNPLQPFGKRQTAGTGFGPFPGGASGSEQGAGEGSGFLGIFPGGSSGSESGAGYGSSFGPFKGGPPGKRDLTDAEVQELQRRQTAGTGYGSYPGGAAGSSNSGAATPGQGYGNYPGGAAGSSSGQAGAGQGYGNYPGGAAGSSNSGGATPGQGYGNYPGGAAGKRDMAESDSDELLKRQAQGCYVQCALAQASCYTLGGVTGNYGNPKCQSDGSACYAKCRA